MSWWRRRGRASSAQRISDSETPREAPSDPAEQGASVETREAVGTGSSDRRDLIDVIGMVVAPASVLTGLGIYFGFLHTHAFYRYLNIDASVLRFSTTDYLIRSVSGFLVPAAVLSFTALVFILFHAGLKVALGSGRTRSRVLHHAPKFIVVLGGLLVVNALLFLTGSSGILFSTHLAAPASMCIGVFLVLSGLRLTDSDHRELHTFSPPVYGVAAVAALLLVVGALWGTAQYADTTGTRDAYALVHNLHLRPAVVIYSRERLGIALDEETLSPTDDGFSYRYTGARLVLQSGGKYLLLTEGWSRSGGWTILLDDASGTRLDFTARYQR